MPFFDVHNHLGVELGAYLRGEFPYGQMLVELVDAGDRLGVTHFIVFPMVTHVALDLAQLRQGHVVAGGFETVPYAWENRRLAEELYRLFPHRSQKVYPFAMFDPGREVPGQIEALRRLYQEYPFLGLKTQPTIIQSPIKALHEVGRPFLELAQELDVPMLIHSSVLPADVWSQAHDILDIAEKWPQVRFNVAHSCRFDKTCLDRLNDLPNCWFDVSAHGIHCDLAQDNSAVVAPTERRFEANYSRPELVLQGLTQAYPGKVLWGSDSPYYSYAARIEGGTLALLSTFERETGFVRALPEAMQQEIGWTNVLSWLGREENDFI